MHNLTAYDYGFRIYNPGIARFLSVDPLTKEFAWYTPYQFAGNKPIYAVDLDGLEEKPSIYEQYKKSIQGNAQLRNMSNVELSNSQKSTSTKVITMGDPRKMGQQLIAQHNGKNTLEKNRSNIYFKNRQDEAIESLYEMAKMTDLNDVIVLVTSATRGKQNAINIDGTEAGNDGVNFAMAGLFIPFVSGSLVKEATSLIKGSVKVFKNGIEVLENAVKIGKYGFRGTKAFNEIVKAVQTGGNIVANSKDEAFKFLKEAFPEIADETGKATSKYGYRIDEFVDEAKDGLKQGHQGWHINYYDKQSGIKGTILVEAPKK